MGDDYFKMGFLFTIGAFFAGLLISVIVFIITSVFGLASLL